MVNIIRFGDIYWYTKLQGTNCNNWEWILWEFWVFLYKLRDSWSLHHGLLGLHYVLYLSSHLIVSTIYPFPSLIRRIELLSVITNTYKSLLVWIFANCLSLTKWWILRNQYRRYKTRYRWHYHCTPRPHVDLTIHFGLCRILEPAKGAKTRTQIQDFISSDFCPGHSRINGLDMA